MMKYIAQTLIAFAIAFVVLIVLAVILMLFPACRTDDFINLYALFSSIVLVVIAGYYGYKWSKSKE